MGIYRVQKNNNYTVMNRTALNDSRLSWKAKGIIAYMLSMPDDWTFYIDELVRHATDGKASFRAGFNELKVLGYVKRFPIREGKGRGIKEWETVIFEVPQESETDFLDTENREVDLLDTDFLDVENKEVDFLDVENRTLLSTDYLLSTEELSTDKNNIVDDAFVFYQNNFGMINSFLSESIDGWIKDTSDEIVIEAMKRTLIQSKRSWKYTEAILKNWVSKNVKTLDDVKALDLEHEKGKQKPPTKQKNNTHVGPVPKWMLEEKDEMPGQEVKDLSYLIRGEF